jgi:hypothetical protein
MRQCTCAAILNPGFRVAEISTAAFAKRIKRAIAEETIKVIGIVCFMTRKKLACLMAEKRVVTVFALFLEQRCIFHSYKDIAFAATAQQQSR